MANAWAEQVVRNWSFTREPSKRKNEPDAYGGGGDRPCLLLVDDIADNLLALEGMLRREDVVIATARSGPAALEILLEQEVALAIIDVHMPGMDGFELAELMRGVDRTRHVPIIFVTAASKDQSRVFRGYEAGAVDFLFKPLDEQVLRSKVDVLITLERQRQELRLARDRIARMQRVTAALNEVMNREAIGDVCLPIVCETVAGATASAMLLTASSAELETIGTFGVPDEIAISYRRIPVASNTGAAEVIRTRQPLFFESRTVYETKYPEVAASLAEFEVGARAMLPLTIENRAIGALWIGFSTWRVLSPEDRTLLLAVAAQCAQALDRVRLYESEKRARREAEIAEQRRAAIQLVSDAALAHLEIDPLLREMLARVRRVFQCDTVTLLLLSDDRRRVEVRACDGIEPEAWDRVAVPYGVAIAGRIVARKEPLVVDDLSTVDVYSDVLKERLRSLAGVPLVLKDDVLGVLHVGSVRPRKFTEDDVGPRCPGSSTAGSAWHA